MTLKSILTRIGVAGALTFATLVPLATADQRDRGHYDRDRGHYDRGHHDRGGYDRGRRDHRDWNRGRDHRYDRGRRDHRRDWDRGRGHHNPRYYSRNYHHNTYRPRVVNRYYYNTPSYTYRSRPTVSYHYNSGYSHPRYSIGSHYNYNPNTIVIRDYNRYGLYNPPHGHHWVRDYNSGDAVLASVATGAIVGLAIGVLSN